MGQCPAGTTTPRSTSLNHPGLLSWASCSVHLFMCSPLLPALHPSSHVLSPCLSWPQITATAFRASPSCCPTTAGLPCPALSPSPLLPSSSLPRRPSIPAQLQPLYSWSAGVSPAPEEQDLRVQLLSPTLDRYTLRTRPGGLCLPVGCGWHTVGLTPAARRRGV